MTFRRPVGEHDRTELGQDSIGTLLDEGSPHSVHKWARATPDQQRRAERVPYGARLTLYGGGNSVQGTIYNLSISGLFLETDDMVPLRINVGFQLPFLQGPNEVMQGRVVRHVASSPEHPSGLGIAFIRIDSRLRSRLVGLVRQVRAQHPEPPYPDDLVL